MIKLQVIGNLGKDCVVNNVNGKTVINFGVAHTEKFSNQQNPPKTIWVECAYWTERTGIAPYLKKGQMVYAEGTPDIRTYTTNDGRQGASLSLRISNVQLLGSKNEGQPGEGSYQQTYGQNNYGQQGGAQHSPAPATDMNEPMDDLPF